MKMEDHLQTKKDLKYGSAEGQLIWKEKIHLRLTIEKKNNMSK